MTCSVASAAPDRFSMVCTKSAASRVWTRTLSPPVSMLAVPCSGPRGQRGGGHAAPPLGLSHWPFPGFPTAVLALRCTPALSRRLSGPLASGFRRQTRTSQGLLGSHEPQEAFSSCLAPASPRSLPCASAFPEPPDVPLCNSHGRSRDRWSRQADCQCAGGETPWRDGSDSVSNLLLVGCPLCAPSWIQVF